MPAVETADVEIASAAARKPADTAASATRDGTIQIIAQSLKQRQHHNYLLHSFLFTFIDEKTRNLENNVYLKE
jgi:hypothetical protein